MDRVSVRLWLIILSDQLSVIALVSHYLTNELILRRPLLKRLATLSRQVGKYAVLPRLSAGYPSLQGRFQRVTHPSAVVVLLRPHDLHVLYTLPALILSQDQTLRRKIAKCNNEKFETVNLKKVSPRTPKRWGFLLYCILNIELVS